MKEFNEYIGTNKWLKNLMDELNEEDGMRLEDSFYAFKERCTKAENLPISNVRLSCLQEVWQAWCEYDKTVDFDEWLHAQMHEA